MNATAIDSITDPDPDSHSNYILPSFYPNEIEIYLIKPKIARSGFEPSHSDESQRPLKTKLTDSLFKDARGLDVCFGYNNARGCRRTAVDATTCRDQISQTQYAHFCSNWDPAANAHCLRPHPRCGNH